MRVILGISRLKSKFEASYISAIHRCMKRYRASNEQKGAGKGKEEREREREKRKKERNGGKGSGFTGSSFICKPFR